MPSYLAVLFAASTLIQAQLPPASDSQAETKQQVSQYASPALVRVIAGCSGTYSYYGSEYSLVVGAVGSGFFVDPNGYAVTNAHVLRSGEESGCRDSLFKRFVELVTGETDFAKVSDREKNEIRNGSQIVGKIDYVNQIVLSTGDSLPFETKRIATPISGNREDIAIVKAKVSNAPTLRLQKAITAESQASVITLGYPLNQAFASTQQPMKKLPVGQPLGRAVVFSGRVTPPKQNPGGNTPVFYFDARTPMGISGSPVLNNKGEVTGITTIADDDGDQQGSAAIVIPGATVLKFVQQAGGSNQEGDTDRLYREGLNLFAQKKFAAARTKFQTVRELFPYHSDADGLMRDSEQGLVQAQQQQQKMLFLYVGAAIVGLFALYWLFSSLRLRSVARRFKRSPEPVLAPEAPPVPAVANGVVEAAEPRPKQAAATQISQNAFSSSTVVGTQQFIELKNQDGQVRRFYLRRERHQLGRDRDWADLHTPDNGWEVLSRHHAVLEKEGADYRIFDGDRQMSSTNGILLNGTPITADEGHLLQDGDRLETGDDPRNQVIWTYSNPGKQQTHHLQSQANGSDLGKISDFSKKSEI